MSFKCDWCGGHSDTAISFPYGSDGFSTAKTCSQKCRVEYLDHFGYISEEAAERLRKKRKQKRKEEEEKSKSREKRRKAKQYKAEKAEAVKELQGLEYNLKIYQNPIRAIVKWLFVGSIMLLIGIVLSNEFGFILVCSGLFSFFVAFSVYYQMSQYPQEIEKSKTRIEELKRKYGI